MNKHNKVHRGERYSYSVTDESDQINTEGGDSPQVKGGDPPGNHRPSPIDTADRNQWVPMICYNTALKIHEGAVTALRDLK